MRVTNTCKATLVFPCETAIDPGASAEVSDDHLEHPVVAGWVDEGKIEVETGAAPAKKSKKSDADKGE